MAELLKVEGALYVEATTRDDAEAACHELEQGLALLIHMYGEPRGLDVLKFKVEKLTRVEQREADELGLTE